MTRRYHSTLAASRASRCPLAADTHPSAAVIDNAETAEAKLDLMGFVYSARPRRHKSPGSSLIARNLWLRSNGRGRWSSRCDRDAMTVPRKVTDMLTAKQIEKLHQRLLAERARLLGDETTLTPVRQPAERAAEPMD